MGAAFGSTQSRTKALVPKTRRCQHKLHQVGSEERLSFLKTFAGSNRFVVVDFSSFEVPLVRAVVVEGFGLLGVFVSPSTYLSLADPYASSWVVLAVAAAAAEIRFPSPL